MTHTTNIQNTIKVLRGLGIDEDTATRAADALDGAGLVTPDLPEPDESGEPDVSMTVWNVGETSVMSTPNCMVMVVGNGVSSLFRDLDALDEYVLALTAACQWARARAKQEGDNIPRRTIGVLVR